MANIKSQKKRALTNAKKNLINNSNKSRLKTALKKVDKAVEANDKEAAVLAFNEANSLLDKAVTSHLKHKNYVARQKARLAKKVATLG
ncbi:MAG: 30S ribosomal protein S20 [Erysipelotrichaceae bacterium]|nr:30S ribosomal protein S20 [Erysipelotrichaceae bacterium]